MKDELMTKGYRSIPGNNYYVVNIDSDIKDITGKPTDRLIRNGKMYIDLYNSRREVDVEWLRNLAWFELELPMLFWDRIWDIRFVKDGNPFLRDKLKLVPILPSEINYLGDYKLLPVSPRYGISTTGIIYDSVKDRIHASKFNKGQYPTVELFNPIHRIKTKFAVHRLKAITFIPNDDYVTKWLVNHLDGDKTNYTTSNLEWCTPSRNNQHAVECQLRKDSISCKVRHWKTKEVKEFASIKSACRYMGVDDRTTLSALTGGLPGRLIRDNYEVKKGDDNSPWYYENITERIDKPTITVRNNNTGKVKVYYNIRIASEALTPELDRLKVSEKAFLKKVSKKFPYLDIKITKPVKDIRVQRMDISTRVIIEYASTTVAGKSNGYGSSRLSSAMFKNDYVVIDNYVFRKYSDDDWDESKFIYSKRNEKQSVQATNIITKETKVFTSYRQAMQHTGVDKKLIKKSIENSLTFKDWRFTHLQ